MIKDKPRYIPALNQNWLTPLYDPALRYVMREDRFKQQLIAQAETLNRASGFWTWAAAQEP